jgi:hypothetical protein
MNEYIYVITRFRKHPFNVTEDNSGSTVGFYLNPQKAIERVQENCCDLNEAGYYPYIVIEEMPEGIHKESWNTTLFEYDRNSERFKKIESPIKDDITNFSMG